MDRMIQKILDKPNVEQILSEVSQKLLQEKRLRKEFLENISENQKAEFINGSVVLQSPVAKRHNRATGLLYKLLDTYVVLNDLGFVGIEKIMISLSRNDYEPDICFFEKEKSQNFTEEQMLFPAPDFVVEVLSKGTAKNDRGIKLEDYALHQVKEYWIIDPKEKCLEQYILGQNQYKLFLKAYEGNVKSQVIKGFEIPILAIFDEKCNAQSIRNFYKA